MYVAIKFITWNFHWTLVSVSSNNAIQSIKLNASDTENKINPKTKSVHWKGKSSMLEITNKSWFHLKLKWLNQINRILADTLQKVLWRISMSFTIRNHIFKCTHFTCYLKPWNAQTKAKIKFSWWPNHRKCQMSAVEIRGKINAIILNGMQNKNPSTKVLTTHSQFVISFASQWILIFLWSSNVKIIYEFFMAVRLFHLYFIP